ncbi:EthD family reductase [Pendulispora rubella]|uniref:EthD family reductase n=1 Tax=Pendulispora rubella TaxID=2741070 RepID=A0ABZ2L5S0_9BACT
MIRFSVFYPAKEGQTFNLEYYKNTHMPLAGKLLEPVRYEVDKGLSGGAPGSPAPFVAACHFYFESLEYFGARISVHRPALQADMVNYTTIEPIVQISEIV